MKKLLAIVLTLVMALSMAAAVSADSVYSTFSTEFVDAVAWYFVYDTTLIVDQEAGTYQVIYKSDIFGTTDPGVKGIKNIIYAGTCTIAPSADGETAHLDITIDTVDSILFEQHEKAWGRQVLNYAMVLNTAAWDEVMDDMYGDSAEAFLANHQALAGAVITVEDLSLDYDDTTLVNKIVTGLDEISLDIAE